MSINSVNIFCNAKLQYACRVSSKHRAALFMQLCILRRPSEPKETTLFRLQLRLRLPLTWWPQHRRLRSRRGHRARQRSRLRDMHCPVRPRRSGSGHQMRHGRCPLVVVVSRIRPQRELLLRPWGRWRTRRLRRRRKGKIHPAGAHLLLLMTINFLQSAGLLVDFGLALAASLLLFF